MTRPEWQRRRPSLVLASSSPARRELLEAVGLSFEVAPSGLDETALKARAESEGWMSSRLALELAQAKASRVAATRPGAIVIGADQILSAGSTRFDKPLTIGQAREQLGRLSGTTQTLHTAVVLVQAERVVWRHLAEPSLAMRRSTERLLDLYVASEGPTLLCCVGACRVEGAGQLLFDSIEGEYSAILGLPLLALLAELRRLGVIMS